MHEAAEHLGIEPAVGVGDERPGQPVDAGGPREGTVGQLRQLAIEAGRQVVTDLAKLLVDDVEVVGEPLGGGHDRTLLADRPGHHAIGLAQHAAVVLDARQQRAARPRSGGHGLRGRQALGVLLEAFDAEQLGPDGLLRG